MSRPRALAVSSGVAVACALAVYGPGAWANDGDGDTAVVYGDPTARDVARVEGTAGFATSIDTRVRGPEVESVGDLLEEAPGLHVRRQGDGFAPETVSLRGAPAAQVTVALDGVVLNDAVSDGVDLSLLPPALIARADVYRGSPPVRLGVGGLGGAIELITRPMPYRPVGQWTLGVGSYGSRRASGFAGARYGRWSVLAALGYRGTQGDWSFYDLPNGPLNPGVDATRQNDTAESADGLARACNDLTPRDTVCVLLIGGWRTRELAGPAGALTVGPYAESARLLARATERHRGAHGTTEMYVSAVARDDHFSNRGPAPLQGTDVTDARSTTWSTEIGTTADLRVGGLMVQAIARGRVERYVPHFTGLDDDALRQGALGGLETSLALGALTIAPAAGIEAIADQGPAGSGSRTLASPRVGLRWRVAPWLDLRGDAGHYERAPSLPELYGDRGIIVGNAGLLPERSDNVDAGAVLDLRHRRLSLRVDAAGYARRVEDLIALVQTTRSTFTPYNLDRATVTGAELGARLAWGRSLRATLAYARVDASTPAPDGTSRRVPGIPTDDFRAEVNGTVGPVTLGADLTYVSEAYLDTGNLAEIPARTLVGTRVAVVVPWVPWLTVIGTVTNLFDVRTGTVPSPVHCADPAACAETVPVQDFFGYPLPGRAVFVSLTARSGVVP